MHGIQRPFVCSTLVSRRALVLPLPSSSCRRRRSRTTVRRSAATTSGLTVVILGTRSRRRDGACRVRRIGGPVGRGSRPGERTIRLFASAVRDEIETANRSHPCHRQSPRVSYGGAVRPAGGMCRAGGRTGPMSTRSGGQWGGSTQGTPRVCTEKDRAVGPGTRGRPQQQDTVNGRSSGFGDPAMSIEMAAADGHAGASGSSSSGQRSGAFPSCSGLVRHERMLAGEA